MPCNDGTIHVIFEPLDFIARLVALVPKPRVNLTRLHGVFASSKHRVDVTPAKREKGISQRRRREQDTRTAPPGYDLGTAPERSRKVMQTL